MKTFFKKHWGKFVYLMKHKYYVFHAGLKVKAPLWRLIKHDWDKFLPSLWIPFADFYHGEGEPTEEVKKAHALASLHHINLNDHHPQYWMFLDHSGNPCPQPMPEAAIREMVADWLGMCKSVWGHWDTLTWFETQPPMVLKMHVETTKRVGEILAELYKECSNGDRSRKEILD